MYSENQKDMVFARVGGGMSWSQAVSMDTKNGKLLCGKCRRKTTYKICKRTAKAIINHTEIEYEESYGICNECGMEIYVPGLDDQNERNVETKYRKEKGLITVPEIREVLKKYNVDEKTLSNMLGFDESTIARYLDGQLPSKNNSDVLYAALHVKKTSL